MSNQQNTDNAPTTVTFSNNRKEGHGREEEEISIESIIGYFRQSEWSDRDLPLDSRLIGYIGEFETEEGLMRYAPVGGDLLDALMEEYERQRESYGS